MEATFICLCGNTEEVYLAGALAYVDCQNCGLVAEIDVAVIEQENIDGLPVEIGPESVEVS